MPPFLFRFRLSSCRLNNGFSFVFTSFFIGVVFFSSDQAPNNFNDVPVAVNWLSGRDLVLFPTPIELGADSTNREGVAESVSKGIGATSLVLLTEAHGESVATQIVQNARSKHAIGEVARGVQAVQRNEGVWIGANALLAAFVFPNVTYSEIVSFDDI